MQPKCAPCTSSESPTTNPPINAAACPNPHQADREHFNHATTTCQPNTRDWSPCSNCENIGHTCDDQDADCWITEQCEDHFYRSPKRSARLFSPVFPTKAKPRTKRAGKMKAANTGKPEVSSGGLKESKTNEDAHQKASVTEGKSTALKSSPKETTSRKTGGEEVTTSKSKSKSKSRSLPQAKSPSSSSSPSPSPSPSPSSTAKRSPSKSISPEKRVYGTNDDGYSDSKSPKQKVFYHLKRAKKKTIDWKKPPKIPIKHTVTSKARNENWFADCGRYRIKAYRGDWNNLPEELTRDYEVFERFFKYRRPVKKNTSLVKKLVQGKIDLQKPRIDKKPFRKRSPVVPAAAGEKPKRSSKLKSSQFGFGVRGARVNLRKQPLIEVKHTLTSSLRRHLEAHSCDKPQTPTYWHGSAQEMEQLKEKIDQRRGQLRNYWKNNGQRQPQPARNDSMNNLIIASTNPSIIVKTKTYRSRARKSNNAAAAKGRQSKGTPPPAAPPQMLLHPRPRPRPRPQPRTQTHRAEQPSDNDINIFQRAIAFKVLPLTKSSSIAVYGHGHGCGRGLDKPRTTSALSNDDAADDCGAAETAKWMLPPTIPIRYSLTSMMRQRSTNKPTFNTIKNSSNALRVAR